MAARKSPTDERLIALFLDMLAAERGAGANTLSAYGRRSCRISPSTLATAKKSMRVPRQMTCATTSEAWRNAG